MKKDEKADLAEALGASRVIEVGQRNIGGPLDLLALRREFGRRLQSSGGRPTDPSWNLSRQVPFKDENWTRLKDVAKTVGASGRRVGPAQVAALLIENSLEEIEDAEWLTRLEESRELPLLSEPDAAEAASVTYNQFDDWVQREWLVPTSRRGRQRSFGADEVVRTIWLRSMAKTQVELDSVIVAVRRSDLAARYLIITNTTTVGTASSRTELYRALEVSGSHLVIDQLPERRKLLGLPPHPDDQHDGAQIQQAI